MEKVLKGLLTGYLPSGKGSYIAIAVGIAIVWASYGLVAFKILGEDTVDALAQQACVGGSGLIEDAEAKAAVIQTCSDFTAKPVSLMVAIFFTVAFVVAAFLRRAIGNMIDKLEALKTGTPPTGPPSTG